MPEKPTSESRIPPSPREDQKSSGMDIVNAFRTLFKKPNYAEERAWVTNNRRRLRSVKR